jgi:predicted GIY-YIG superfamily endonuclease
MYVVYALIDPRDNSVRYVGITDDVYRRFQEHIQCAGNNFTKNAWIMDLRSANKMVFMETLEEFESRSEALKGEQYWISHFERMEEPLMNVHKSVSPRKSKKTNLQTGRKIVLGYPKPVAKAIDHARSQPKAQENTTGYTHEQLEMIDRMRGEGVSNRKIAQLVGLSGRKYGLYQAAVKYLENTRSHEMV